MPINRLLSKLYQNLLPNLAVVSPQQPAGQRLWPSLAEIFDGFLLVQKRKRNPRIKWRKLYGYDNWSTGTKLWKPKRSLATCPECGSFHEFHTICRECFNRVNNLTKAQGEQLAETKDTKTWFEPNVTQVKNPTSQESPQVIKETQSSSSN